MAIQRPDPLRDMRHLKDRLNRLFDEALSKSTAAFGDDPPPGGYRPPVDLLERPDGYVLLVDLPGVSPADISIEVEKGTLVLRGERRMDPSMPADAFLRVERPHGQFAVQLKLPPSVEAKRIQAATRDGIVRITLPKRQDEADPDRLKVDIR